MHGSLVVLNRSLAWEVLIIIAFCLMEMSCYMEVKCLVDLENIMSRGNMMHGKSISTKNSASYTYVCSVKK